MSDHLRPDLLRLLCAELPDSEARRIRSMSPDDVMSYVEAFTAANRTGVQIAPELRRAVTAALAEYAADTERDRENHGPEASASAADNQSLADLVKSVVRGDRQPSPDR